MIDFWIGAGLLLLVALAFLLLPLLVSSVTSVGVPCGPTTTLSTLCPPTPLQASSTG